MVEQRAQRSAHLDRVFKALSDPTRRAMLARLKDGACNIGELGKPHRMSFAAAAKHVQKLEQANLVSRQRRGREQICTLNPNPLAEAQRWLDTYSAFWNERLDALEVALGQPAPPTSSPANSRTQGKSSND